MSEKQEHAVGRIEEFPAGEKRVVAVAGHSIGIFNVASKLYAVQNLCPHALAPLCEGEPASGTFMPSARGEWIWGMDGYVVRCPAHRWEYDMRSGESVCNVDRRKARTYPVAIEEGMVVVTLRARPGTE